MEKQELKPILEALIFASEEPLGLAALIGVLEGTDASKNQIQEAIAQLLQEYNENGAKGLLLREVGGAYQFVTKPSTANFIQKLDVAKPKTLSQASLETLAIVAYRQPVVRSEVEEIRGVDSGGVLKTLLERGLIKIVGRREEAGQPLIYGTTPAFLELFHLAQLEELPSMKEIEQIVEEQNRTKTQEQGGEVSDEEITQPFEEETESPEGESVNEDQALSDLDASLKNLRRIEKEIFPKEATPEEPAPADNTGSASNTQEQK